MTQEQSDRLREAIHNPQMTGREDVIDAAILDCLNDEERLDQCDE